MGYVRAAWFFVALVWINVAFAHNVRLPFIEGEPPVKLPFAAQVMVHMETRANPAALRPSEPFRIGHLEIPLRILSESVGEGLEPKIRESMVFRKNGEPYVRWILNPEDTVYGQEMRRSLIKKGLDASVHYHYVGYLTSSRSCIVQDPVSRVTFSIKASTDQTGGNWRNKKETVRAAQAGRMMSDFLVKNLQSSELQTLGIIKEPLAFSLADVDQAIIVRQYDHFNDPSQSRILIPAFSATHEETGRQIAQRNGSITPAEFWREKLIAPLGDALAELVLLTGVMYNSPHGQNFMVELDRNYRPTGKIFAKDYADANLQSEVMNARGGADIVRLYSGFQQNISYANGILHASVNPLYSGSVLKPSWLPSEALWKDTFLATFSARANMIFRKTVGLYLPLQWEPQAWGGRYWTWQAVVDGLSMNRHLNAIRILRQEALAGNVTRIADVHPRISNQTQDEPDVLLKVDTNGLHHTLQTFVDSIVRNKQVPWIGQKLSILVAQAEQLNMEKRNEFVRPLRALGIDTILRSAVDNTELTRLAQILFALDPHYTELVLRLPSVMGERTLNVDQNRTLTDLLERARRIESVIESLRTGYLPELRAAIRTIQGASWPLRTSVADAFAYRINREIGDSIKIPLMMDMARYGQGDRKVVDFLEKHAASLSQDQLIRLREIHSLKPAVQCRVTFAQAQ